MNSSNSDAPPSNKAHECSWVDKHRGAIINLVIMNRVTDVSQIRLSDILKDEEIIQCRVCHGANLAGANENFKGSDCLSCHVADPIKYPVMCYSCHGGQPATVIHYNEWLDQYTSARGGRPIDATFVARVERRTIHNRISVRYERNHDAVPYNLRDDENACRYCHGGSPTLPDKHHSIGLSCLDTAGGCHPIEILPGGGFNFVIVRDCLVCHESQP